MEQINVCCICAEVETEADGCARVICGALQHLMMVARNNE